MNLLSRYRMELFGIAALGTVLTHSQYFVQNFPRAISALFGYGGSGVYIFALLSGIGLHFSLANRVKECVYLKKYYKKRASRLFIPYLLITGIWYAIKYILCLHDPVDFFFELSTLSFWMEHKGAWYVAMLIPVYIFFPFFYNWVEATDKMRSSKTIAVMIFNTVFGLILYAMNPALFEHLRGVWCAIFFFILGNYIGKPIMENRFNDLPLLIISCLLVALKSIIPGLREFMPMYTLTYALSGVIVAIIASRVFLRCDLKLIRRVLYAGGVYSLEIYLSNLVWIQVFQFWNLARFFDKNGVTTYMAIIVLGIISSVGFGKLSKVISAKI